MNTKSVLTAALIALLGLGTALPSVAQGPGAGGPVAVQALLAVAVR